MFDIGFWELVTIGIIGIVVVGPDRLPETVRTVMGTVRKFRRMFDDVKGDIERELNLDEMRRHVEEADINEHIRKLNQSVMDAENQVRTGGKQLLTDIDRAAKYHDEEDFFEDGETAESAESIADTEAVPAEDFFAEPDPEQYADTGIEKQPTENK